MKKVKEFKVRCLYDRLDVGGNELCLMSGNILVVTHSKGSWYGGYNIRNPSKFGYFPYDYVEKLLDGPRNQLSDIELINSELAPGPDTRKRVKSSRELYIGKDFVWKLPNPKIKMKILSSEIKSLGYKKFTQYVCQVNKESSGYTVLIKRRYSHFFWLNQALTKAYPDITAPPFPEKKITRNLEEYFIMKRKDKLESYMYNVLEHPVLGNSDIVIQFLSPDTKIKDMKNQFKNVQCCSGDYKIKLEKGWVPSYNKVSLLFDRYVDRIQKAEASIESVSVFFSAISTKCSELSRELQKGLQAFENSPNEKVRDACVILKFFDSFLNDLNEQINGFSRKMNYFVGYGQLLRARFQAIEKTSKSREDMTFRLVICLADIETYLKSEKTLLNKKILVFVERLTKTLQVSTLESLYKKVLYSEISRGLG